MTPDSDLVRVSLMLYALVATAMMVGWWAWLRSRRTPVYEINSAQLIQSIRRKANRSTPRNSFSGAREKETDNGKR